MKLGKETNSFFNHLMANSMSVPKVGEGATILHWTDRTAYFVNSVSEDGKTVEIERAKAIRVDNNGMSEVQDYKYERNPNFQPETIKFRYGKWRKVCKFDGKTTYSPISIVFGEMKEYYDYSF